MNWPNVGGGLGCTRDRWERGEEAKKDTKRKQSTGNGNRAHVGKKEMRGGHRTCHAFEMGDLEGAPDLLGGVLVARVEVRPLLADGRRGALFHAFYFLLFQNRLF